MNPADRESVERLQAGDREAFVELYDRYGGLLHPLALRITGNAAEADEALFEAWALVVKRTVSLEPRRGVAAWLLSLVRTRALERRRASSGAPRAHCAGDGGPIEVSHDRVDLADRATEALGLLDDYERQVIELAFYEGLTQDEISLRLHISVRDVRTWTRQGLDRLEGAIPSRDALPFQEAA